MINAILECLRGNEEPQIRTYDRLETEKDELSETLQELVTSGSVENINAFLTSNYFIDPRNVYFANGRNALTEVAGTSHTLMASNLIGRYHMDVNSIDRSPWAQTPLHRACKYNEIGMAVHLINLGADINRPCGKGSCTPLHWVASRGNLDLAKILIDRGADINALDDTGATPLRWAIAHYEGEMSEFLSTHGGITHSAPDWVPQQGLRTRSESHEAKNESWLSCRESSSLDSVGLDVLSSISNDSWADRGRAALDEEPLMKPSESPAQPNTGERTL